MSKKQYTVTTVERVAQPRSSRRQGAASATSGGSVVITGTSEAGASASVDLAAQAHSHDNKPLLDSLSDEEGYLLLRQKAEDADESEVAKVKAGYADEAGVAAEARGLSEDSEVWGRFLRKDTEDTAAERIHFAGGLDSGGFESGSNGFGVTQDADGNWHVETDHLHVRKKLSATEVEILKASHIGGVLVASAASMTVSAVSCPVEGDPVPLYRCKYNKQDAEGNKVELTFAVGDLAYCQTFNYAQVKNGMNRYYWRKVVAVNEAEGWIDLGNRVGEYAADSDWPEAGDRLVLLGNVSDATRQNAIVLAGAGEENPYLRVYTGIKSFTLPEADVQISPHGTWITVTDRNGKKARLDELIASLEGSVAAAQEQADGMWEIWFGDAEPTADNYPAEDWEDDETRAVHEGDLYYNRGALNAGGGRAWTWVHTEEGGWHWSELTDKDVLASLEAAARAQDTADGKRRVFRSQPKPPYDAGDLWANATYPVIKESDNEQAQSLWMDTETGRAYKNGEIFNNDLVCCTRSKAEGEQFSVWDWGAPQELTTARYNSDIRSLGDRIDLAVTDLSTGLEAAGIHLDGEKSKITLNAATTEVSDDLVVKRLETKPDTSEDADNKARVVISGSTMDVYGSGGARNIQFGVDANGYAVLKYFNNNGQMLYDLGPNGMNWIDVSEEEFIASRMVWVSDDVDAEGDHSEDTTFAVDLYYYKAKRINGVVYGGRLSNNDAAIAAAASGLTFTDQTIVKDGALDTSKLANGLYRLAASKIQTFDSFEKYGDVAEARDDLRQSLGLSEADVNSLDWSVDEDAPVLTLKHAIYWQYYTAYSSGKASNVVRVWQYTDPDK